jgi:hypothetical protein
MCDDKRNKENGYMAKNMKKIELNNSNTNVHNLDKILAKGIQRYDKTLKKLSKN